MVLLVDAPRGIGVEPRVVLHARAPALRDELRADQVVVQLAVLPLWFRRGKDQGGVGVRARGRERGQWRCGK